MVFNEELGEAERGLFIIDPEGNLRYLLVSDDNVGRSVEETLRVVKALQTGGKCPIDWQPGEANIKVD
jgi:alkyl hydroperoxide reductase subunit AhpC